VIGVVRTNSHKPVAAMELGENPQEAARAAITRGLKLSRGSHDVTTKDGLVLAVTGVSPRTLIAWIKAEKIRDYQASVTPEPKMAPWTTTQSPQWKAVQVASLPASGWRGAGYKKVGLREIVQNPEQIRIDWNGDRYLPFLAYDSHSLSDLINQSCSTRHDNTLLSWQQYGLDATIRIAWKNQAFRPSQGLEALAEQYAFVVPLSNSQGPYLRTVALHR